MIIKHWLRKTRKRFLTWLGLGVLVGGLVLGLDLGTKVSQLVSEATGEKADIRVDVSKNLQTMPRPFNNLAQGGEETGGMIGKTVAQVKQLSPNYIRLDHIYDYYQVVTKENGQLRFNFNKLDNEVEAILKTGAKPLLALSYMPPGLGPDLISPPDDWNDWQALVKETVSHYSGKGNKNISNVYYEVWNEPDLFGGFKTGGDKNYLELYRRAALGASEVKNVNQFKIGGPATTGLYKNWVVALLKLSKEQNIRLDFISWHRYSMRVEDFSDDVNLLSRIAKKYPELALKEKLITEWGFDPENNPGYDSQFGAAHMLAATRHMLNGVHKAFVFEIIDGKDPAGQKFWGRFGLLTHESAGMQAKPRFEMMKWINQIGDKRLGLTGEGSWVKGIAAKNNQEVQIYLVNYDANGYHHEAVPVVVTNLKPGQYQVAEGGFMGSKKQSQVTITKGTWTGQIIMQPNEVVRLTLKPI